MSDIVDVHADCSGEQALGDYRCGLVEEVLALVDLRLIVDFHVGGT